MTILCVEPCRLSHRVLSSFSEDSNVTRGVKERQRAMFGPMYERLMSLMQARVRCGMGSQDIFDCQKMKEHWPFTCQTISGGALCWWKLCQGKLPCTIWRNLNFVCIGNTRFSAMSYNKGTEVNCFHMCTFFVSCVRLCFFLTGTVAATIASLTPRSFSCGNRCTVFQRMQLQPHYIVLLWCLLHSWYLLSAEHCWTQIKIVLIALCLCQSMPAFGLWARAALSRANGITCLSLSDVGIKKFFRTNWVRHIPRWLGQPVAQSRNMESQPIVCTGSHQEGCANLKWGRNRSGTANEGIQRWEYYSF